MLKTGNPFAESKRISVLCAIYEEKFMRRRQSIGWIFLGSVCLVILLMPVGCHLRTIAFESGPDYREPPPKPEKGPPPWAPARGYRAKHHYRYYPSSSVYYERARGTYFYYRDGRWQVSVSLPRAIRVDVGDYVTLEMDSPRPYQHHEEVRKRYPPGKMKKKAKRKGKHKW